MAIGTDDVAELMVGYQGDPDFGVHAANVLRSVWERKNEPTQKKKFPIFTDYSEVAHKREARANQVEGPSTSVSDTILAVANELARAAEPKDQLRGLELARVGFSLPYANRDDTIATLLALPTSPRSKLPLLSTLVRAGEVVSADFLMHGIRTLFEDAKTERWRLDNNNNELEQWLELIPFSDNPLATLDALALVPNRMKAPWELRGLLRSLRYAPAQETETVLQRLAEADPRWLTEYEWIDAFIERGTASSLRIALELTYAYKPIGPESRIDSLDITRKLAEVLRGQPEVKAELLDRYRSLPSSPGKTIAAQIIAELGDPEGVMLLVDQYAAVGQKLDGALSSALRKVAVGERPSEEWAGSDELYSVALPELRKALFTMTQGDGPAATLAIQCLNLIDALRDDYGPPESEPRHPDITSGRPRPIIRQS